jgi:UDP-4-amino-4,6-dideoxy-N-acetyl-beta-L-altrosamine transaminase
LRDDQLADSPIPYARQSITDPDIEAVVRILRSDWLTQGPAVKRFEKAVAEYCGARYAVAVNSGTSALHISCLAAGLGPGDSLWTSPNTFVASANCALYCGARVDFVDIDPQTLNLSISALEKKLTKAKAGRNLPKVVIPVHFAGQSCDMAGISELAARFGFTVIEDACHATGGRYRGSPIGTCAFSDMTVFSFHPVKIITTGEGGMVLTNREDLYRKLARLRSHGITREPGMMEGEGDGPWYYQQIELGFNYRMTDMQAALGASQLVRIDEFVRRRHVLADRYADSLKELPATLPVQHPDCYSAYHLYVVRLELEKVGKTRRRVFEEMRNAGIHVHVHYIPVHTQPYYRARGFRAGDFPEAERYYKEALTLPMYSSLTDERQDTVIRALKAVLL